MKADEFNQKDYDELTKALEVAKNVENLTSEEYQILNDFFKENENIEYNEFLIIYEEKYGKIIKQYREREKMKTMKILYFAAIVYFALIVLSVIIWLVMIARNFNKNM